MLRTYSNFTKFLSVVIVLCFSLTAFAAQYATPSLVSGGEAHSLVLDSDGILWSFGDNGSGQLGTGGTCLWATCNYRASDIPVMVHGPNDVGYLEGIKGLAAGWEHSMALEDSNRVLAWGTNESGQLGIGTDDPCGTPVYVHDGEMNTSSNCLENIVKISTGRSGTHSLAVDKYGVCWSWGNNDMGQVGNNESPNNALIPVRVHAVNNADDHNGYLSNIIAVSAGQLHSMALSSLASGGFVYTFGDNAYKKLGIGEDSFSMYAFPVKVLGVGGSGFLSNIVAISAGWDHCMALEDYFPFEEGHDGRVYTWGNNGIGYSGGDGGRLGNGKTTDYNSTPVYVFDGDMNTTSGYLEGITAIGAGESHCIALDNNGNVWAWGDNDYGQLGNGGIYNDSSVPVQVKAGQQDPNNPNAMLSNIVAISAGYWHNLAVDSNGNLYTWGSNDKGKLGVGNNENCFSLPQLVKLRYPSVYNLTQEKHYYKIQDAIDDANSNDVIEVETGTYNEALSISNKPLTLQGQNQYDWQTVSNTIIDLNQQNFDITDSNKTYIKGLTIRNGNANINSSQSNTSIENCIVEDASYGIINDDDLITISNCIIRNNDYYGIYFSSCGSYHSVIENCLIYGNGRTTGSGIYLPSCAVQPYIRNCTITKNYNGIKITGSTAADVKNSIIHGNNTNIVGSANLSYCMTTNDPCFYDEDANNFHIKTQSACINAGNPSGTYSDYDIDGEDRVIQGRIDIGADECYRSNADFNHDDTVNFVDYARFAKAWGTSTGQENWDSACDLVANGTIDNDDLAEFVSDWLWEPSYLNSQNQMMMMSIPADNGTELLSAESSMELQAESAALTVPAETAETPVDVNSLVDWLDEVWLSGELSDAMTETEYLEFKETIEQSGNTGIQENQ